MNAASAHVLPCQPVATISAPKRKNVITWKLALTLSLNAANVAGISWRVKASTIPATNAAMRPFPYVTSASPKATNPTPSAYVPSYLCVIPPPGR